MSTLDIDAVASFLRAAELKSFTRAAEALGTTQSLVSTRVKRLEDGLGRLLLQRCRACDGWIWSPRPICPACHSFDLDWQPVEPVGTVYSWTRTWQPFTRESTGHLPYVVVLVELTTAGRRRVLGVLSHADGVTPRIGAAVRGHIEAPPDEEHWPLIRWELERNDR